MSKTESDPLKDRASRAVRIQFTPCLFADRRCRGEGGEVASRLKTLASGAIFAGLEAHFSVHDKDTSWGHSATLVLRACSTLTPTCHIPSFFVNFAPFWNSQMGTATGRREAPTTPVDLRRRLQVCRRKISICPTAISSSINLDFIDSGTKCLRPCNVTTKLGSNNVGTSSNTRSSAGRTAAKSRLRLPLRLPCLTPATRTQRCSIKTRNSPTTLLARMVAKVGTAAR